MDAYPTGDAVQDIVLSMEYCGDSSLKKKGFAKVFIVSSESATVMGSLVMESAGLQESAKIVGGKGECYANIYTSSSQDLKVVMCKQDDIPEALEAQMCKILIGDDDDIPSIVVSLGDIRQSNYLSLSSDGSESIHGVLKKLVTTSFSTTKSHTDLVESITLLECGNIITGLSSAILNHCEVHSIPAITILSITNTLLSLPTMQAYEHALPFFEHAIGCGELNRPDMQQYKNAIKKGSFVRTTNTLYV